MLKKLLGYFLATALFCQALYADKHKVESRYYFPSSKFPSAEWHRLTHRVLGKKWLQDPEIDFYFQRVNSILAPKENYFFAMADINDVNAFAYLGGLIVVYRGLWDFVNNEDELLGVMAHEMGHVKLDHPNKARENAQELSTLTTPLLLAGLLIDDPDARNAVIIGSASLTGSGILSYSRELEHEADIFALDTMFAANRDPQKMVDVFSRFSFGGSEYLSTHPSPKRRSAYFADRLFGREINIPPSDLSFLLLQEKMRIKSDVLPSEFENSRRKKMRQGSATEKLVSAYGLLLLAIYTHNKALGEEMTALLQDKKHPFIIRATAENMFQRHLKKEALQKLKQANQDYPDNAAIALQFLNLLERNKQYVDVFKTFNSLPRSIRERPDILKSVGRSASLVNQHFYANYLLARGQALDGFFEQAQKQIIRAEKLKTKNKKILLEFNRFKKLVKTELKLIKQQKIQRKQL